MTASVRVHGMPGQRLLEGGARRYGAADASRGAFIERAVARALEHWLAGRPDCAGLHLFHDLGGFRNITGHGLGPVSLGRANIDHVVLSGAQWLLIDSKGLGAGTLTTDPDGRGVLVRADGTSEPQRWMDSAMERSLAGVLVAADGSSRLASMGAAGCHDAGPPRLGEGPGLQVGRDGRPDQRRIQRITGRGNAGAAAACGSRCGGGARPVRHRGAGAPCWIGARIGRILKAWTGAS